MKTPPTPKDNDDEAAKENIQKRLNNLYSKQELPSHASISEVEAMKARINELETKLAQQAPESGTTISSSGTRVFHDYSTTMTGMDDQPKKAGRFFNIAKVFRTSIRNQLTGLTIFMALIPALILGIAVGVFAIIQARSSLQASTFAQLESVRAIKLAQLSDYFESRSSDIAFNSRTPLIYNALISFSDGFNSSNASVIRSLYLTDPDLANAGDDSTYSTAHSEFSSSLSNLQSAYGYYDVFLITRDGQVVYTYAKEDDFGTNLVNGPYADTNLGQVFRAALDLPEGKVVLSDFEFYAPSFNAPAAFIAAPIYENGRAVGALAFQISLEQITAIMQERTGLGKTGETYLVGADKLFRSESRFTAGTLLTEKVDTIAANKALNGETGSAVIADYRGIAVFSTWEPLNIGNNLHWAFIAEIDEDEALAPANRLTNLISGVVVVFSLIIAVIAVIVATALSRAFVRPILSLTQTARAIADGHLDMEISTTREDELGVMAHTFKQMTARLRELIFGLERRAVELKTVADVGAAASTILKMNPLLQAVVELTRERFGLYHTQIYLADPSGRTLILRAGSGKVGAELLQRGHNLLIGSGSLNGLAAVEKRAVLVEDTKQNPNFLPNPLLPNTRSEMTVPLIAGEKVLGVLDIQSEQPDALNQNNLPVFEALASQIAIAIQNSALFKEVEEARLVVEEQARRLTSSGWHEFMNAIDRNESIGYVFNQDEVLPLVETQNSEFDNTLTVPIKITGANVGEVQLSDETNRKWTTAETEIVQAAVSRVGQHIENLRLLAQAEKYRQEAEQVSRRLTHEGWGTYLKTRSNLASGYSYNLNEIKSLGKAVESNGFPTQTRPITVHDETIGELMVNTGNVNPNEVNEIFSAVATQLGDHIENLRLLEETQQRTLDLEEAQTFLDSVVENLPTMLFVKDAEELRFVRWNKAAEELAGFEREALIGKNDYDFFPKEEADFFTSNDRQVLMSGQILDIPEEPLATAHQGIRYLHTRKVPIYSADGKAKYLLGVSEDITERKHNQEILAQRANQLETVATLSSTASTVLDPDKLLQAVVDLTKERFNMYHTHIYLADDSWNTLLLAAGAGEIGRQMVETGHAIEMDAQKSLVARASRERKAIIVNDVQSEAGFLPNPMLPDTRAEIAVPMIVGDKVLGVFDVQSNRAGHFTEEDANIYTTLAAQVAVALQNARLYVEQAATVTQLRELDKLKSSFLANMSHELRTPLNSILGFADVMLEELDGPLTENMTNDLGLIQKNGQHLLHLINDVLDMAKIESGKMNLNVEKFILHDVIDEVTSITSSLASEKALLLFIEPDSDHDVEINADKIRLRQVMINLVNNAMKFTETGRISIRAQRKNDQVLIAVKDTGIGIPPEHLESVFQEFTQVDTTTTRKTGGTGLGLPISRRLIQMHSGRLWAESTGVDGEGATFYVQLPIEANINEGTSLTVK